jgi:hypothetical protein
MWTMKRYFILCLALLCIFCAGNLHAEQLWTKCHVTCRCLHDNTIGNFAFTIPVDKSPDIGFEADWACKVYGEKVCSDGCNGTKYTFTYQVVSP